jgi:hypothetical protein
MELAPIFMISLIPFIHIELLMLLEAGDTLIHATIFSNLEPFIRKYSTPACSSPHPFQRRNRSRSEKAHKSDSRKTKSNNETGATKYILCTKKVIVHISTVIDIFAAPLVFIVLGH